MNTLFCLGFLFVAATDTPSYPFSLLPSPQYKEVNNWILWDKQYEKEQKVHSTIEVDSFFLNGGKLTIQATVDDSEAQSKNVIRLYKNQEWIQAFENEMITPGFYPKYISAHSVKIGDLNDDGLQDFRILYDPLTNGLSLRFKVMYFIQQPTGRFIKYSFNQQFEDKTIPLEYDFNGDGVSELLSIDLVSIGNHNYWRFQVYEIFGDELRCASKEVGYPIFIQFKNVQNFSQYTEVVLEEMEQCSTENELPYSKDNGRF